MPLTASFLKHNQDKTMKPQDIVKEKSSLWIFGYGSLVWKPDFAYKRSVIGYINGYKRRFWHGDDFYRGDKEKVTFFVRTSIQLQPVSFSDTHIFE